MKNKLTLISLGLIILLALFFNCERQRANRLSFKYLKELSKNAQLVEEKEGLKSKLVGAVATQSDLTKALQESDKKVAGLIKSRNEKVEEINRLNLAFTSLQAHFRVKSTLDSAGRCIVPLDTTLGKIRLFGRTVCDTSGGVVIFDTLQITPLALKLYKAKVEMGLYRYYVSTGADSAFVSVDSLEVMFKEQKPSFWQRNSFKLGLVSGVAATAVTIFLLK